MKIIMFILLAINVAFAGTLKTPESAQPYRGKIYVSNIGNLPPDSRDGDGFISVLDMNGKVIKERLCTGLNAPKGIAFAEGKLFVTDIDRVVVFDPSTGKKLKEIKIKGAKFLNDAVYDGKNYIYISDTQTNRIYRIDVKTYKSTIFIESGSLEGANGLAFDESGNLIVASWGGGKLLKIKKNRINTISKGFSNLDGVCVSNGNIYFSDFTEGKIYLWRNGKVKVVKSGLNTPADIGCKGKQIFVPEFYGNTLKIVRVE